MMVLRPIFKYTSVIQWLTTIGVFLPSVIGPFFMPTVLEICAITFGVFLLYLRRRYLTVDRNLMILFLVLLIAECIIIFTINYPYNRFIQQYLMLVYYFVCYYILFKFSRNCIYELFNKYIKLSYIISLLAIIQFCIHYILKINIFRAFVINADVLSATGILRVNAILMEPGVLATVLVPAVAYYILYIKKHKKNRYYALMLLVTIILTFSTLGYVMLTIIILYAITRNFTHIRAFALIGILIFFTFISSMFSDDSNEHTNHSNMQIILTKLEDTINGIQNLTPEDIEVLNLSSYATLMNLYIAKESPSRLFGTGLGNHPYSYEQIYQSNHPNYGLNKNDAYSLLTRIYSELGIVGIFLLCLFIIKNRNSSSYINTCTLIIIIAFLIRGGHYTLNGTIFFLFMYYYSNKKYEKKINCNICS